jgi:hypothetical protein
MILIFAPAALAGGWTQPEGAYYVKAGYRAVAGIPEDAGFDATGEVVPLRPYGDHALQVYGEYGLSDPWTVLLNATPLGFAAYDGARTVFAGPTSVGVRRALTQGAVRTAVEVQLGGTPPLGARDLAPAPDVVWQPAAGTAAASGALQLGYGFGKSWLSVEAGLQWRSHLSEVALARLQLGRQWEHLVLDLHLPVAWALSPLDRPVNYMGSTDTRYVGVGVGIGWWITERVGLATGFEGVLVAQANAASLTLPLHLQLR